MNTTLFVSITIYLIVAMAVMALLLMLREVYFGRAGSYGLKSYLFPFLFGLLWPLALVMFAYNKLFK